MARIARGSVTITDLNDGENGLPGEDGIDGVRGPGRWSIGVTTLPTNTSEAALAWTNGTGVQPADPVADDQAWFYTGTESSPTSQSVWIYSGTAWANQEEVISGELIVNGTITADKINAEVGNFGKLVADIGIFGEIDTGLLDADSVITRSIKVYPEGVEENEIPTISEDPETELVTLSGAGVHIDQTGDVYIGDYDNNRYMFWDQSVGQLLIRGDLDVSDLRSNTINAENANFTNLFAETASIGTLDVGTLDADAIITRDIKVYYVPTPEEELEGAVADQAPTISYDEVEDNWILTGKGANITKGGHMYVGDFANNKYMFWNTIDGSLTFRGTLNADDIVAGSIKSTNATVFPDADSAPDEGEEGAHIDLDSGKFIFGNYSKYILWDGTDLTLSGVKIDASSQVDALAGITFQEDGTTFTHTPEGETEAVTTAITTVNLSTNLNGTVSGQTITLTSDDTNDYVDSASFSGGNLTLGRTGSLGDISVSLDGRYLQAEADTIDTVLGRGNTTSKHLTVNNMTVSGNLTVSGTTTSINTEELNLADNTILLNSNFTGAEPTENAGIEVERGSTENNVALIWNESNSRWSFTNDGSGYHNIPTSSDYDKYESWTVSDGTNTGTVSSANTLEFEGTGAVSVSYNDTDKKVKITGTNTTYGVATNAVLGLVKVGYTESGKNYPVELNGSNQMFVNVPWVDNNDDTITSVGISGSETTGTVTLTGSGSTTVTQNGSTVTISSTDNNTWNANSLNVAGYVSAPTTTNKNKVWKTDNAGVPAWRDDDNDDTTYSVATDSALGLVKVGFTEDDKNYPVELNESNQMYVNVPWSDNTVTVTSTPTDGDSDKAISSDWAFDNVKTPVPVNAVFTDNDTWVANSVTTDGYVSAPTTSNANKVWKTDDDGVPAWRTDDNDNTTYSNATTTVDGLMSSEDKTKLDGVDTNANNYTLPKATTGALGGVQVGANLSITAAGVLSADSQAYTLPAASANDLGGIKVGTNLSIDANGVLSATDNDTTYSAGNLIDITNGSINVDLSELTDMTADAVSTDELVILDGTAQRRKQISEIPLSLFNNNLTGVAAETLGGQTSDYYLNTSTEFGGDVSGTYNAISIPGKANIAGDTFTGTITVPEIDFLSPDESSEITATMLDGGTLSFSGSAGQLFSISDSLDGTIFSVNDISGIPSIEVEDDGTIRLAEYAGNVLIGTDVDDGTSALQVDGTVKATEFDGSLDWTNVANKPTINNDIDYINAASFSTTTGVLTLSGAGNAGATVDLDGRYLTSYTDTNTTYDLSVPASTTKIRLADSNNVNDDVEIAGGSNVTVTRTNANKLTISSSFTNTTYAKATSSVLGLVKIGYSEDGQNYPVELNNDGQMYVNVPWSNTQRAIHDTPEDGATTTSISSNWAFDNVKTAVPADAVFTDTNTWVANAVDVAGYVAAPTTSNANKVWKTNASGVPAWRDDADTDTTYSVATDSVLGLVKIGYTLDATNRNYPVQLSSDKMYVNVPWSDNNTWNANTKTVAGYVSAPGAVANKVWKTDANGNPGWRDDADTNDNTITKVGIADSEVSGTVTVEGSGATTVTQDGSTITISSTDNNTWNANAVDVAGYVSAPTSSTANKVWKTDANGVPDWRDDANDDTNTTYTTSIPDDTTKIRLNGSTGSKDDIEIAGGTNVTVTRTSDSKLTISSTDNNTWTANTKTVAGYVSAPGAVANKVWKTDASGNPGWRDDANTWTANSKTVAGYVSAPGAVANKVWKTDASGNPGWRDDANTWTANSNTAAGYVASGAGQANKVWKTDAQGNPAWRADVDTNTNYYINSASFSTSTGVITLSGNNASAGATVDIDGRYQYSAGIHARFHKNNGNTGAGYYYLGTFGNTSGFVQLKGTIGSHVETFGTNKLDLSLFAREGNSGTNISIDGTFSVAYQGAGLLVYRTANDGGYESYALYLKVPSYAQIVLDIDTVGLTYEPGDFTTTAPDEGFATEIDTTGYGEGFYKVIASTPELVVDTNTDTNTTYSAGDGLSLSGTEFSVKNHSANFDTLTLSVKDLTAQTITAELLNADAIITRNIKVYPVGGTVPAIDGTTISGSGAILTKEGDVMIGDSAGKHIFFDQSEGTLEIADGDGDDRTEFDGSTITVYSGGVPRVKIGAL